MLFCRTGSYFCGWKHVAVDSEFFVSSTLEKYHQISLSDLWSATYDLGWIKLPKIKSDGLCFWRMFWKSSLLHVYKFSFFNTSNTYRVFGHYFRPRWKPLVDARVGDRRRLLSEVFERKADYFILTTSSEKNFSLITSRKEKKNTWNSVKITISRGNYNIFTFFFVLLAWDADQGPHSRTKDHRKRSPFFEF